MCRLFNSSRKGKAQLKVSEIAPVIVALCQQRPTMLLEARKIFLEEIRYRLICIKAALKKVSSTI